MELNKIYNWNCIDVMKQLPNGSVNMVLTSPPYDNLRDYNWYEFNFEWIADELLRIVADGWVVVWIVNDGVVKWSETWTSFRQALYFKEIGFSLHDTMIWQKNNFSNPSNNRYHQIFEYMFIFSKWKPKTFNPIIDRKNVFVGGTSLGKHTSRQKDGTLKITKPPKWIQEYWMRYNVWKWNTAAQENMCKHIEHPATFPLWLAKDHILSRSNEWDIVLDPMCWSWTTCLAAKELGRNYIWIDISKEYCEIAENRLL